MRVDGDAAAVVTDSDPVAGAELYLDAGGVTRDRLVHRIVENLGDQVVETAFVRAPDIHAGAAANRLQPFQNLDIFGGVVVTGLRRDRVEKIGHRGTIGRDGVRSSRMK